MRRLLVMMVLAGCSDNAGGTECGPKSEEVEQDPQGSGFEWDTLKRERAAPTCRFKRGDLPRDTLGDFSKIKTEMDTKVKHVIVIMRENRSFDHYLGSLRAQHDELPANASNPDPIPDGAGARGAEVVRFPSKAFCSPMSGPNHEWTGSHLQYNNGSMNGFVAASGNHSPMGFFTEGELPFYYWLAKNFALSESYFSSLLGPTMANISFYYNATACGTTENIEAVDLTLNPFATSCSRDNSIFKLLREASPAVSFRVYNDAPSPPYVVAPDSGAVGLTDYSTGDLHSIQDFRDDVAANRLPEVVFIEPNYGHIQAGFKKLGRDIGGTPQNDEHPPSNVTDGQHFVWDIINTLLSQPGRTVFNESVVFISWDENGGFYDHVKPPPACVPDPFEPCDFKFDRYGFRVPFFAVSPYAIKERASRYTADHTSILRFIEAWKDLKALTDRDANAWPLFDMFDFGTRRDDIALPPEPPALPCPPEGTP